MAMSPPTTAANAVRRVAAFTADCAARRRQRPSPTRWRRCIGFHGALQARIEIERAAGDVPGHQGSQQDRRETVGAAELRGVREQPAARPRITARHDRSQQQQRADARQHVWRCRRLPVFDRHRVVGEQRQHVRDYHYQRQQRDAAVQARVECGDPRRPFACRARFDVQKDHRRGRREAKRVRGVPDPAGADPRAAENADGEQSGGNPEQQSAVFHSKVEAMTRSAILAALGLP